MTSKKADALAQIISLAKKNKISASTIAKAMSEGKVQPPSSIIGKVFAYLGGTLVLAGICVYVEMFWAAMGSPLRILITLGTGFAIYIWTMIAARQNRNHAMIIPLFLISALLQTTGLFVAIHELLPAGPDYRYAVIFVATVMLIQQLASFFALRQTVLLFNSIYFAATLFYEIFDVIGVSHEMILTLVGFSILCFAYRIARTSYSAITGFWYFIGSMLFLIGTFDLLNDTSAELIFLGLSAMIVYLSTIFQSRSLLFNGIVSIFVFISYFTQKHFIDSVGWPLALIFLGLVFVFTSIYAVRLHKKYM